MASGGASSFPGQASGSPQAAMPSSGQATTSQLTFDFTRLEKAKWMRNIRTTDGKDVPFIYTPSGMAAAQLLIEEFADIARTENLRGGRIPYESVQNYFRMVNNDDLWPLALAVVPEFSIAVGDGPPEEDLTVLAQVSRSLINRRPKPMHHVRRTMEQEMVLRKCENMIEGIAYGDVSPEGTKEETAMQDACAKHLTTLWQQITDLSHTGDYTGRPFKSPNNWDKPPTSIPTRDPKKTVQESWVQLYTERNKVDNEGQSRKKAGLLTSEFREGLMNYNSMLLKAMHDIWNETIPKEGYSIKLLRDHMWDGDVKLTMPKSPVEHAALTSWREWLEGQVSMRGPNQWNPVPTSPPAYRTPQKGFSTVEAYQQGRWIQLEKEREKVIEERTFRKNNNWTTARGEGLLQRYEKELRACQQIAWTKRLAAVTEDDETSATDVLEQEISASRAAMKQTSDSMVTKALESYVKFLQESKGRSGTSTTTPTKANVSPGSPLLPERVRPMSEALGLGSLQLPAGQPPALDTGSRSRPTSGTLAPGTRTTRSSSAVQEPTSNDPHGPSHSRQTSAELRGRRPTDSGTSTRPSQQSGAAPQQLQPPRPQEQPRRPDLFVRPDPPSGWLSHLAVPTSLPGRPSDDKESVRWVQMDREILKVDRDIQFYAEQNIDLTSTRFKVALDRYRQMLKDEQQEVIEDYVNRKRTNNDRPGSRGYLKDLEKVRGKLQEQLRPSTAFWGGESDGTRRQGLQAIFDWLSQEIQDERQNLGSGTSGGRA